MGFYWVKTRWFIKSIFRNYVWSIPNPEKTIYLTFDDGPAPEITEWVLDLLNKEDVKATFFCIGNNIDKHPAVFRKIIDAGHAVGNHTYNHLNGWNIEDGAYYLNVDSAEQSIVSRYPAFTTNKLFRPPYGKITASQSANLRKKGYQIIMWDVLSADFDQSISPEKCLKNVINNTCAGSVIIFHDSIKASRNLYYALPKAIDYLRKEGYSFDKIS